MSEQDRAITRELILDLRARQADSDERAAIQEERYGQSAEFWAIFTTYLFAPHKAIDQTIVRSIYDTSKRIFQKVSA